MGRFADYTHQLVPFASGLLLTVIVWAATVTEAALGVLLLTGWRPILVGAATCLVLIIFGTAMAVSLGMESALSYSVFSAASAAAAYAILGTISPPHTTGALPSPDTRNRREPTDGSAPANVADHVAASHSDSSIRFLSRFKTQVYVPIIGSEGR